MLQLDYEYSIVLGSTQKGSVSATIFIFNMIVLYTFVRIQVHVNVCRTIIGFHLSWAPRQPQKKRACIPIVTPPERVMAHTREANKAHTLSLLSGARSVGLCTTAGFYFFILGGKFGTSRTQQILRRCNRNRRTILPR